jgi:hypothetical protein
MATRGAAYRTRAGMDLLLVDALVRLGRPEAAAQAVEEHSRVLRAYVAQLESVIADASVEREAEEVLADAVARMDVPAAQAARAPAVPPTAAVVPAPRRRRALVGALAAAVLALAGMLPTTGVLQGPGTMDQATSWEETRAELEAARQWLEGLERTADGGPDQVLLEARELHDRLLALPRATLDQPSVRQELGALLEAEDLRIRDLAVGMPQARRLLVELRALRAALGLPPLPVAVDDVLDLPVPTAPELPEIENELIQRSPEPAVRPAPTPSGPAPDTVPDFTE